MRWNRRDVFKFMTGAAVFTATARPFPGQAAPKTAGQPDARTFASGDLLWPALPNTKIIYEKSAGESQAREEIRWEREHDKVLELLQSGGDPASMELRETLANMSYEDFRASYLGQSTPIADSQDKSLFSAPNLSVGHVAIVEIDKKGKIWIVEAMPKGTLGYKIVFDRFSDGVIRTAYTDWIAKHTDYNIWHGRIKTKAKADRGLIVKAAKSFLGKDYWLWSLNFADETAFYCSKLIWVSVNKALGLALDGDTSTARQKWLSPKRLMKLDTIAMLYSPAPYGE
jgi:hypothetical protein